MRAPLWLVLVGASLAVTCGSAPSPAAPSPAAPLQAVVFAFEDVTALTTAGGTAQAIALGIAASGTTQDVTAACTNWQSDDGRVLAVSPRGVLTALTGRGSATISTTCQRVAAQVTLNLASAAGTPAFPPRIRVGATCADGWPSSAVGSGACSSHGGVACWVYSDHTCTNP